MGEGGRNLSTGKLSVVLWVQWISVVCIHENLSKGNVVTGMEHRELEY